MTAMGHVDGVDGHGQTQTNTDRHGPDFEIKNSVKMRPARQAGRFAALQACPFALK